ncbi:MULTISPECIES: hypothetical protein [Chryseobacterium]|uniref:DUF4230 domain-containing protein n=1 Tax=Chryseobacterium camelliae TaxID=1265445 RepID=A0ABU0TKM4_9FLAO|nr:MULTISPECIES: hypothetical protein [Chryseobacterium]MDT3408540.1 hypothetical protein [Pseudacidovorax intermedius]MDQ1097605.1 hypothetical protein [Chryseobacterium camelliae]MDQ1101534.1 hypothetical protein [Chryseobacterium sp. SORGH_AS_1048]MDR6084977.1 hypothetical protein [Chryseobacterium sp. SORGH_AS_0909]MDR6129331.1 hypothetical protein [Chryseobacterium sp. SORGH_AS_1175]
MKILTLSLLFLINLAIAQKGAQALLYRNLAGAGGNATTIKNARMNISFEEPFTGSVKYNNSDITSGLIRIRNSYITADNIRIDLYDKKLTEVNLKNGDQTVRWERVDYDHTLKKVVLDSLGFKLYNEDLTDESRRKSQNYLMSYNGKYQKLKIRENSTPQQIEQTISSLGLNDKAYINFVTSFILNRK